MEENVKRKILSKSKATLGRDANYPCPRSQEPLSQNQPADEMVIPAQVQDSFPEENAMQNQRFYEAQFASQTQQHIHYQESVGSLPDFTQPPDWKHSFLVKPNNVFTMKNQSSASLIFLNLQI